MVELVEDILSSVGEWVVNIDKPRKALIVCITMQYIRTRVGIVPV